jgi:hypothetical protein
MKEEAASKGNLTNLSDLTPVKKRGCIMHPRFF